MTEALIGQAGPFDRENQTAMTAADAMGPALFNQAPGEALSRVDGKGDDAIDFYLVDASIWREGTLKALPSVQPDRMKWDPGPAAESRWRSALAVTVVEAARRVSTTQPSRRCPRASSLTTMRVFDRIAAEWLVDESGRSAGARVEQGACAVE